MPTTFAELKGSEIPLLSELMNTTFTITGFSVDDHELGERAVVETESGTYATFSAVLIKHLRFAKSKNAIPLTVKLVQRKRYHTFE